MSKLFIIIQARMTSTRLPGKVLLPLCGKTVLEVMLNRLGVYHDDIIIATTNDGSEEPIVELCEKLGVKYYRGDTDDVLSRYYEAAVEFGAKEGDTIVRLTSDCPLIDGEILSKMIDFYHDSHFEYVSNCINRTFPRGLDVEIFSFSSLKNAYKHADTKAEKEHVTPYIRAHTKTGDFLDYHDNSMYRLTLDEEDDYTAIQQVYKKLDCRVDFSYEKLLAKGVGVQPYYKSLGYGDEQTPMMDTYFEEAISLPMYPLLSEGEQKYVIKCLKDVLSSF